MKLNPNSQFDLFLILQRHFMDFYGDEQFETFIHTDPSPLEQLYIQLRTLRNNNPLKDLEIKF